jgi:hypothetical protein
MDAATFRADLERAGFTEIEERTGVPNFSSKPHTHPFEVRALILEGEFILTREGAARSHGVGDTFEMAAECVHFESFGPIGSKYIIGRRHPPA